MIDAHTFITYEKQIRNLHIQEARLVRRREKETAELRALREERIQKQQSQNPAKPAKDGFVFSTVQIDRDSGLPALSENFNREHSSTALAADTRLLTPSS